MSSAVTRVVVEREVDCPFSVAHDYAEDFLRHAEGEVDVRVPLRDFIWIPGHVGKPVRLVFALHPDETDDGRQHDAMLIEWRSGSGLFPDFHGTLRMRIASVETTRLTFEGAYRPPMGLAGKAFDAVAGRAIARATLRELLERIGDALERREREYRAGLTATSGTAP